ncbi:MAG: DNA repair protein RadC [Bacteroidales bacterium]|nr:DNA repair protein RadC [Bacteroidales bacterium]
MILKEMASGDRPREKMLRMGASALGNDELLTVLIRTGAGGNDALEIARKLLLQSGGKLRNLATMSVNSMCEIAGLGQGKAVGIAAAFELGRRLMDEMATGGKSFVIRSSEDAYRLMRGTLCGLDHEELWLVLLNRANRVLEKWKISSGGLTSTTIDVKMVAKKVLEKNATGVLLFHNHPSNDPHPGKADMVETQKLKKALETFDVRLLDHVIVTDGSWFSFEDGTVSTAPPLTPPSSSLP